MSSESNPYQPPNEPTISVQTVKHRPERPALSVVMIVGGLVFFFTSAHTLLGRGPDYLTYAYDSIGRFAFGFLFFYGAAGLFTAILHFCYLMWGKPEQAIASMYAIGIGIALSFVSLIVMDWLIAQRTF